MNYPETTSYASLLTGNVFANYPIIQLGIQGPPNTKFYINGSENPIILGKTGIYELDLQGLGTISSINFDRESLEAIDYAQNFKSIMIDIAYEGGTS